MTFTDQVNPNHAENHRLALQQTIEALELVLRRDLKLGNDIPINQDTPLLGGDHDLDSLDILMLLTSVEKQFNIKIPNDAVRRDAFTNVGTLAAYINERRR